MAAKYSVSILELMGAKRTYQITVTADSEIDAKNMAVKKLFGAKHYWRKDNTSGGNYGAVYKWLSSNCSTAVISRSRMDVENEP